MYYKIEEEVSLSSCYAERPSGFVAFFLINGKELPKQTYRDDFVFEMSSGFDEKLPMDDWFPSSNLMSQKMLNAILSTGVENVQSWPTSIRLSSGKIRSDYFIVNIIGSIPCANPNKSNSTALADSQFFFDLTIDPDKLGKLKIFRVAESKIDIIVHKDVANAITTAKLHGVKLVSVVK